MPEATRPTRVVKDHARRGSPASNGALTGDGAIRSQGGRNPAALGLWGPMHRPPLVGRDRELASLDEACAQAEVGRGGVALIAGEAGIGNTAIVEEFRRRSLGGGKVMVWGSGHDGDDAPPFWMWGQIVRALVELDGPGFDAALTRAAVGREQLAALVPEWFSLGTGPAGPADAGEARFRLCVDTTMVLGAISATTPMVIVLDDLQWADVASLGLLEFMAPRLVEASILLVGTYRDNEVSAGHPLAATLGALARLPRVVRIFPRPLSTTDVAAYLSAVSDHPPGGEIVDAIWARTGGNPFFMTELVKLLVSEHDLDHPAAARGGPVPAGVGDVIRRRLSRLPEQTNNLLSVAAVIGQDFDLDTLAAAG